MNNTILTFTLLLVTTITIMFALPEVEASAQEVNNLTEVESKQIEEVIVRKMNEGKIPGLSVTIIQDNQTVFQKGFGYSDIEKEKRVTPQSLFELASNSKAFTALAVINLAKDGQIELTDDVTTYIPWLRVTYKGKEVPLTIEQVLYQTTGIPSYTINNIPVSNEEDALEETVRTLIGIELDSEPGEMFQYATINYDILGLIIEQVSGKTYEEYLEETILKPLQLNHTYLFRDKANENYMTTGYKIGFLKARQYEAPIYRGNKPAGYIISSGEDMATWLRIQMDSIAEVDFDREVINYTHQAERKNDTTGDEVFYAGGWFLEPNGQITHEGMNPNYASYITFNELKNIGVAVLGNLSSNQIHQIGITVNDIMHGEGFGEKIDDANQLVDRLTFIVILVLGTVMFILLFFIIRILVKVYRKQLTFQRLNRKMIHKITISFLLVLGLNLVIYYVPSLLLNGFSWEAVFVWSPQSVQIAFYIFYSVIWLSFIFYGLKSTFYNKDL